MATTAASPAASPAAPRAAAPRAAATRTGAPRATSAKKLAEAKRAALAATQTPSEAAAYSLITEFNDLEPSVRSIMSSDLTEEGREYGISLFRASLGVPGDPNRIPTNAIAAARKVHGTKPA